MLRHAPRQKVIEVSTCWAPVRGSGYPTPHIPDPGCGRLTPPAVINGSSANSLTNLCCYATAYPATGSTRLEVTRNLGPSTPQILLL